VPIDPEIAKNIKNAGAGSISVD